jgi:uncharacterized protein
MRKRDVIIFFSIVLTIYGLINCYVFISAWQAIPESASFRGLFTTVFLFFALSFIIGRFLERVTLSWLSSALVWIGSFYLAAMVYVLLMVVAIDLARLTNFILPFFPPLLFTHYQRTKELTALTVGIIALCVVIVGHINARRPRVVELGLVIPKNSHKMNVVNIVVVSDIHLGTIICKARLEKIVNQINQLDPDLVLLPGDVVDEDLGPVIKQNLGETLRKIQSRFGTIAITGNHEYIGGVEAACRYLADHGITMLRDNVVKVNDSFYVVGREDRSYNRAGERKRKPLEELMIGVETGYPVILLDHQPFRLDEAERHGIDLQLSGHTHHGQLWPFNFIAKKVYELSWGYKKKGATHVYVSCGVGTWGPPVRTGNRPEIVNIRLTFG